MSTLDSCCLLCLLFTTAHGAWRGWTAQGFYCLMALGLYVSALKISTGHYSILMFPDLDIVFRSIIRLEVVSPLIVMVFFLARRFHNKVFVTHKSVPGHHVAGALFGLMTGLFSLLYLFVWLGFTDLKTQTWWTSSIEYQVSIELPVLIKIAIKYILSAII
jgi:hypothetical protein